MTNPYQSPESGLSEESGSYTPSVGWKILFFFLIPLEIWSQYDAFTVNKYGEPLWWLLLSCFIYIIFYVGLFGLAFSKRFGTPKFWLSYLPILVITDLYELKTVLSPMNMAELETLIVLAIVSPLILIVWFSVYKYQRALNYF